MISKIINKEKTTDRKPCVVWENKKKASAGTKSFEEVLTGELDRRRIGTGVISTGFKATHTRL